MFQNFQIVLGLSHNLNVFGRMFLNMLSLSRIECQILKPVVMFQEVMVELKFGLYTETSSVNSWCGKHGTCGCLNLVLAQINLL